MKEWLVEICTGRVMHKRLKPAQNQFSYGVFFLRVPLSSVDKLSNKWISKDRFNLLSFMTRDYGPRDGSDLEVWARSMFAKYGLDKVDGEIVLQTFPRVLGYVFNPISVWYGYDRSGQLRAALCEVSNTFGERHDYLIAHSDQRAIQPSDWLMASKTFHVSPFCEVKGHYRFRFEQTAGQRSFLQIDYFDGDNDADKLLITTIHGEPQALVASSTIRAFFRYPMMTVGVIMRIHWQALRLWLKRVPFFSKPDTPVAGVRH